MYSKLFIIIIINIIWFDVFGLIIVLDAGHGGEDHGYSNRRQKKSEKDINLLITKKIGYYITHYIEGVRVIYTHQKDETLTLDERVQIANGHLADIFISIHCNSSGNQNISGPRIHIHSKALIKDLNLAKHVDKSLTQIAKRRTLNIQDATDRDKNFQVIQYTEMVSLLIEVGFLSNVKERKFLNTLWGQDHIAKAISLGIKNFLKEHETTPTGRYKVYKVQIAASNSRLGYPDHHEKRLDMRVETYSDIASGKKKYYYLVGHYHNLEEAKINLAKIRNNGFQKAFIVRVR